MTFRSRTRSGKLTQEQQDILTMLSQVSHELRAARNEFNLATEPELVEACVYKINALQAQYAYYSRLAKHLEVSQDFRQQQAFGRALLPPD